MTPAQKHQRNRRHLLCTTGTVVENKKKQLQNLLVDQDYIQLQLRNKEAEIRSLQRQLIPNGSKIGSWDCCNSPIGVCCYRHDDYSEDFCIYCGEPDERK